MASKLPNMTGRQTPGKDHKIDEIVGMRLFSGGPRRRRCRWCKAIEGTAAFAAECPYESAGDDSRVKK